MGCVRPLFASGGLLDLRSSSSSHMRRSPLLHLQDPVRPCFCHKEHTQPHFSYFLYGCRSNLATFQCFYSQGLSIKRSLPFGSHWSDAMHTFQEKFNSLSSLIVDHDIDSTPQEEFLSFLGGARTIQLVHQFLVNSLCEVGVKRVSKVLCGAGKELQRIVLDHLQIKGPPLYSLEES
ncbi:hypothetical protein K1719_043998 [Acacia pycnantha]|nr:hypothetical protein K1719_043998 [Acacia pycnantha]